MGDWSGSDLGRLADFDLADVEPEMNFIDYIDEAARRIHLPLLAFFANPLNSWIAPDFVGLLISKHTAESALSIAEKEIGQVSKIGQPLFMFVFLSTTHLPYAIPEGEPITFGDPNYKGLHERQLNFSSLDAISTADLSQELKNDSQRIKDLYDSTVWRFDQQVARIDTALKKSHLNNTIFIVLADHGEDQWDPGVGLSRTLHAGDQSIRIPFIVRWPDHLKPHRIQNLLRATDVVPTLADLADATDAANFDNSEWKEKSFKKLLEGESLPDDRSVFIESGISWTGPTLYPPDGPHLSYPGVTSLAAPDRRIDSQLLIPHDKLMMVMKAKDRVFIQGRYKVAYQPLKTGPLVDMCDLEQDPWCQKRLKPDPQLAQKLKAEIMKDPEEFYLAWPREVFDQGFAP
ncbi:MAG: sulfatase-like hydrolase/transferase [Deltaproteobacteria bacterium]|nr:MAG: sulfatase-like hydrolase/transferase [Deltaproteobacteria bacterium]